MEIHEKIENRIIEVWLTNADREDKQLCESVKQWCAQWKQQGLFPVLYFSGQKNLYDQTLALLDYNKRHPKTV